MIKLITTWIAKLNKRELQRFFILTPPDLKSLVLFGSSHFFNRIRANLSTNSFDTIIDAKEGRGAVFLGQIPIKSLSAEILPHLSATKGLVISCNEYFEMSGRGTAFDVVKPHLWESTNIKHHHLPFTDYTCDADPSLVLGALKEMKSVYDKGGSIYVHCKAGTGRSPFLVILFHCFITCEAQLKDASTQKIKTLLQQSFAYVQGKRPHVKFSPQMLQLAMSVIQAYQTPPHTSDEERDLYRLVQSSAFKALWNLAYVDEAYFQDVQIILNHLYNNVEKTFRVLANPDESDLKNAISHLKLDKKAQIILEQLRHFWAFKDKEKTESALQTAFTELRKTLEHYASQPEIKKNAYELANEIFLSELGDEKKAEFMQKTIDYLKHPNPTEAHSFIKAAIKAIHSKDRSQTIGKYMIGLAVAVLSLSIIFAFLYPALIPIASCALVLCPTAIIMGAFLTNTPNKEIELADIPLVKSEIEI